jgi:hypothetical protein
MAFDISNLSFDDAKEAYRQLSRQAAKALPFSADGYKAHYHGVSTYQMPPFVWDWVQEFFEFYGKGVRRFGFKAHRGSTKSFTWSIGFPTYWLSQFPADAVLVVQKNDTSGGKTSSAIADIIENNIGWKSMYPHLVPDRQKRWAFEGYEIMDTSMPYDAWRQKVQDSRPKDNSFVGYGWANGSIVGLHPHLLIVDDILDEENTRSKREMSGVASSMKGNVLQTLNRPPGWSNEKEPIAVFSYTPWYENDFYAYIESTGVYHIMETPLIRESEPEVKDSFEWRGKHWVCAWSVKEPEKLVEQKLLEYGEMDFARMQLLDLKRASGINLKRDWLHEYPAEKINNSWPCYIGVDYASTADKIRLNERDYFSLSIGRVVPGGGVVLVDGYRGHVSATEAESLIHAYYAQYNPVQIGFDKTGKGEDAFYRLNAKIPVMIPCPPKGMGKMSKGERIEGQGGLGPAFQFSQAWISDVSTPFLNAFREEWEQWPNGRNDDTLDSTYWMLFVAQAFLNVPSMSENLAGRPKRAKSGFAQIASQLENR